MSLGSTEGLNPPTMSPPTDMLQWTPYLSSNLGVRKLGLQVQGSEFSLGDRAGYELHAKPYHGALRCQWLGSIWSIKEEGRESSRKPGPLNSAYLGSDSCYH